MAMTMGLRRLLLMSSKSVRWLLIGKICGMWLRCLLLGLRSHGGLDLF
jgi:hypothetical protein